MNKAMILLFCITVAIVQLKGEEYDDLEPVGPNEIFKSCRTICPPQVCASIYSLYDCTLYSGVCEPGFDCLSGYLRNGNESSVCVPSEECTFPWTEPNNECEDPNAIKKDCGSSCDKTCANRNPICTADCVLNKCECVDGYVLDELHGKCIALNECPICSDPNANFQTCASSCQPTCQQRSVEICTADCFVGCVCNDGYILDQAGGTCILPEECPESK